MTLAPTQTLPLDATMGPAAVTETVNVVGRAADVLTQTAQVATNFKQDLIATLPTNRDINAALLLAPAVHPTGPSGAYSIAGAMSFESLFLVNGVTVNENLRGQAYNLVHRGRRFRKRRSPPPASRPSSAASAAASSTSSRSRAATCSAARSATR